jgi:hypothetical protein
MESLGDVVVECLFEGEEADRDGTMALGRRLVASGASIQEIDAALALAALACPAGLVFVADRVMEELLHLLPGYTWVGCATGALLGNCHDTFQGLAYRVRTLGGGRHWLHEVLRLVLMPTRQSFAECVYANHGAQVGSALGAAVQQVQDLGALLEFLRPHPTMGVLAPLAVMLVFLSAVAPRYRECPREYRRFLAVVVEPQYGRDIVQQLVFMIAPALSASALADLNASVGTDVPAVDHSFYADEVRGNIAKYVHSKRPDPMSEGKLRHIARCLI